MQSRWRIANGPKYMVLRSAMPAKTTIGQVGNFISSTDSKAMFVNQMNAFKALEGPADIQVQQALGQQHADKIASQLGVNPAFIGLSHAGDSGRKFEAQRAASISALKKTESSIKQFYRNLGRVVCHHISQYYKFNQAYNIAEKATVSKWVEINEPATVIRRDDLGNPMVDEAGEYMMDLVFEQVRDPGSGEIMVDEDGNELWAPVPRMGTEIKYFDSDVKVDTAIFDNDKETAIQYAQHILNGTGGSILAQMFPAAYLRASAMLARGAKNSATNEVAESV